MKHSKQQQSAHLQRKLESNKKQLYWWIRPPVIFKGSINAKVLEISSGLYFLPGPQASSWKEPVTHSGKTGQVLTPLCNPLYSHLLQWKSANIWCWRHLGGAMCPRPCRDKQMSVFLVTEPGTHFFLLANLTWGSVYSKLFSLILQKCPNLYTVDLSANGGDETEIIPWSQLVYA